MDFLIIIAFKLRYLLSILLGLFFLQWVYSCRESERKLMHPRVFETRVEKRNNSLLELEAELKR